MTELTSSQQSAFLIDDGFDEQKKKQGEQIKENEDQLRMYFEEFLNLRRRMIHA